MEGKDRERTGAGDRFRKSGKESCLRLDSGESTASLFNRFDVSFETSFHFLAIGGIAACRQIGTDVAMDIVSRSRPRGVLANRSIITSLPFSDNRVLTVSFSSSLSRQTRNSIFRASIR